MSYIWQDDYANYHPPTAIDELASEMERVRFLTKSNAEMKRRIRQLEARIAELEAERAATEKVPA